MRMRQKFIIFARNYRIYCITIKILLIMKKLFISIVALVCTALNVSAGDALLTTLTFPATKQESIGNYTSTWKATQDDMDWTLTGFNNNKNAWAFVKCGRKSDASVATIKAPFTSEKITKFVLTVDACNNSKTNAVYLEAASDSNFTKDIQKIQPTFSTGEVTYSIPSPAKSLYFRFTFDCQAGGSNGFIVISKIQMYKFDASTVSAPTFTPGAGTYYETTNVTLTGDQGADIYYSFDGESYNKYTAPVEISETKTLYAYAQIGETKSEVKQGAYSIAKSYASFDALLVDTPTTAGWPVVVPFTSEEISSLDGTQGVYLTRQAGSKNFELYCKGVPTTWKAGTKISGTAKGIYKIYGEQWEIALVSWDGILAEGIQPPTITFDAATKTVTLTDPSGSNYEIYYTLDGTDPDEGSTFYQAPFTITETTTVKAICFDGESEKSSVASKVCTIATTYNDLATIAADAMNYESSTKVATTLNLNNVLVTGANGKNIYVSDSTGVFLLYDNAAKSGLTRGDKIGGSVKGNMYQYNGVPELEITDSWTSRTIVSQGNTVTPTKMVPANVTVADVNKFVRFEGLRFVSQEGTGKVNYTLTDGTTTVLLRDNFQVLGGKTWSTSTAYTYNLNVFVVVYSDGIQYYAVSADDVETISSKTEPSVAFTQPSITVNLDPKDYEGDGYKVELSYTTNSDGELSVESTNEDVATAAVETNKVYAYIHKTGKATITLNTAESATYAPGKAQLNIISMSKGDGTESNPYSVGDVYVKYQDGDTIDVWVKAYIVGNANNSMAKASFSDTLNVKTNLLLADDVNETNVMNVIPLELPAKTKIHDVEVRDSLAMPNHPENYKKQILVHASIIKYFSQAGLKKITDYKFVEAAGLKGDANNDGVVDVADITAIAAHILGKTPEQWNADNADANNDKVIDVADITATAALILGSK